MKYPINLILQDYGVTLRRLTHDKIEMLRQWRNDPKIQQFMFYREKITPEMQEKWFQNVNNDNNFYFIIEYQSKEIGLIDIKDIDYEKKCGEPGLFIYADEYLNSDVAIRASLCMDDWVWDSLGLNYQHIEVVRTNIQAIKYNRMLGFEESNNHSDDSGDKVRMILTREKVLNIQKSRDKIKKILRRN